MTIEVNATANRPTIKEQIATRLLDQNVNGQVITTQADFDAWMEKGWYGKDATEGKATVRDQSTAKAMLATWIEERIKAHDGVWFGPSDTTFALGLLQRQPINVNCPDWMTAYIRSFPKSPVKLTAHQIKTIRASEIAVQKFNFEEAQKRRATFEAAR